MGGAAMSDEAKRCEVCSGIDCPVFHGYKHENGYLDCRNGARTRIGALTRDLAEVTAERDRLTGEREALSAEQGRLRAIEEALPRCSGKWLDGSGGHKRHAPCPRHATYYFAGDIWAYCDEHITEHEKRMYSERVGWADEVTALDALLDTPAPSGRDKEP
jgi:hypothetical protein